ncbi:hypothetical protein [uncultured Campylobacter sp.]|uniref:hypothetical protein n=1 Tax=uncultured Campylobacter sp. TaxID=218934 RepID=UPI00262C3237|nr:hypothetical protein [uncultured Campylobacter sp.]
MTLALIRHVTPLIDRGVCDAAEAARRAILYDATQSLALWQTDKFKSSVAYEKLARVSRVCSSPLPRLRRKSYSRSGGIEYLEALREFNLRIFPMPLIKMPFDCWLVLSRLLWLCGMNHSDASAKEERRRALDMVPSLLETDTAVIAHGFVLRVIRHSARQAGYRLIYRFCEGCFCVEIWQRAV